MATTYTYSLAGDFGGTINNPNFLQQVENAAISPALLGTRIDGDAVKVTFASALSGAEQTTLDGVVSAHVAEKQEVLDEVEYEASGTAPPTVNTDTTGNFESGSIWVDQNTDDAYICIDAGTGAAVWKNMTTTAASLNTSFVTATTTTSTTSNSYVVIDSMTITPSSGVYQVIFSSSGNVTNNGANGDYAIHVNGTIVAHSERFLGYGGGSSFANARNVIYTIAEVTVTGTEAIDVRYQINAGSFQIYPRSLHLLRTSN